MIFNVINDIDESCHRLIFTIRMNELLIIVKLYILTTLEGEQKPKTKHQKNNSILFLNSLIKSLASINL